MTRTVDGNGRISCGLKRVVDIDLTARLGSIDNQVIGKDYRIDCRVIVADLYLVTTITATDDNLGETVLNPFNLSIGDKHC